MIFNLLSIRWEGWAKWIEIASIDVGVAFGALLYLGHYNGKMEWDLLYIKLAWRWMTWRLG